MSVPVGWNEDLVEFWLNESSWCADNIISELESQAARMGCLCDTFSAEFVRDATPEDKKRFHIKEIQKS